MSPDHFYKYMSPSTAEIVLDRCTLRWSTPGTLNDPFDMQFDLHVDADHDALKTAVLQKMWDAHYGEEEAPEGNELGVVINAFRGVFPQLSRPDFDHEFGEAFEEGWERFQRQMPVTQAEVRARMADSKVLCLTTRYDNVTMWSHYADSHRGLVLRMKIPDGIDSALKVARPVRYVDALPKFLDDDSLVNVLSGQAAIDVGETLDRMVYTKSLDWEYEEEWRIYAGGGRDPNAAHEDLSFFPEEVDGAILGCRATDETCARVAALAAAHFPHASLHRMERNALDFGMTMRAL